MVMGAAPSTTMATEMVDGGGWMGVMDNKAMDNRDGEVIDFMDGELYGWMDGWTDTPSVVFC